MSGASGTVTLSAEAVARIASTKPLPNAIGCLKQNVTQNRGGDRVGGGISKMAKQELLATIRDRYRASSKKDKGRILDEFIAVTGHHRKHGIRLLGQSSDDGEQQPAAKKGRRIYDESVTVVWEAAAVQGRPGGDDPRTAMGEPDVAGSAASG